MIMKKIVFFGEIDSVFYPLVEKYLKDGFIVYSFNIEQSYKSKPTVKKYLETGRLIDLSKMIFDYALYREAVFYAFENLDNIFDKYFSSSRSIKSMEKLLEFPRINDMYKYKLLIELKKIYQIELKINKIIEKEKPDEVHFLPYPGLRMYPDESISLRMSSNPVEIHKQTMLLGTPLYGFKIHSDESSLLTKNVKVLKNDFLIRTFRDIIEKLKQTLLLGAPLYILFKKVGGFSRNKNRKHYKVGIKEDYPKNIFLMNYHGTDIFIDEKELPVKDVLFIVPWNRDKVKLETHKNFNCTSLYDGREVLSFDLFWNKIVKCFSITWFKLLFFSLFEEPLISRTNRSILFDYITLNILLDKYKINNYVRRMLPDNASATHILSQHNVETWFVFPDNTSNDYHLDWDPDKKNREWLSFMYFDNAIIHGNIIERDFKKHRNPIKNYIKTGVLFSQTIREIEEGKLDSSIFSIVKNKKLPKKIIGVFDTTFADYGPITINEGVRFGNDILRLLDEFPDIGIIFKAAKEPNTVPKLTSIYDKLKKHERCLFFYHRSSKEGISAPEVIAASDLTLSAAYTSTTAEALGARKKAIYYDCTGRHTGKKYYFNNLPNFVAHDYDELKSLVKYWLYEVTDKKFDSFLNKYVKDEIDPYLDGKAFSRLRKLLTKE